MSLSDDIGSRDAVAGAIASYKTVLREVIDRRPSGTRRRLSHALGKHRSFVTQITNPAYAVPIPASHLKTIFEICHFSPPEAERFLDAYHRAHPGRAQGPEAAVRILTVAVPDLGEARNRTFDALVRDLIARLARHAESES